MPELLKRPFTELPLLQRALRGALLRAGALGGPAMLLLLVTMFGGRYQRAHGFEQDMVLMCAAYPLGAAIAGSLAMAFAPMVRRAWQAGLLGCTAAVPMFALLSLADDPHGVHAHHVTWPLVIFCSAVIGGLSGVMIYRDDPSTRTKGKRR